MGLIKMVTWLKQLVGFRNKNYKRARLKTKVLKWSRDGLVEMVNEDMKMSKIFTEKEILR